MNYSDILRWFTDIRNPSGRKDEYSRDEMFEALLPYCPLLKRADMVEAPFLTYTQDGVKIDWDYEYSQDDIEVINEFSQDNCLYGLEFPSGHMSLQNFSGVARLMDKETMLDWVFHRIFDMKKGIKYWINDNSQLLYLRFDGETEYFAEVSVLDQRTPRCLPKSKSRGLWIYNYRCGPTYKQYGETKFWYAWH